MAVSQYIQNIDGYFKSLPSSELVRASMPKDWPSEINARDGKLVGLCNFYKLRRLSSIAARTLTSVDVAPTTASIAAAATQQLSATAKYDNSDEATVTSGAVWSSDNESIATVSTSGLVTGVAAGTANITALYGGVTSNASVITVA